MQCPTCGSRETIRKGRRKSKREEVQMYRCETCKRHFSDRDISHKSYPARLILNAISAYNLGRTLEQTRKEMARRFHTRVPESTIHSWVKEYSGVCRFMRLRGQAIKLSNYKPEEMVFARKLNHRQIYNFQLHRAKLSLQSEELPPQKFLLLKAYLEKIPTETFPHHLFQPKTQEEPPATRSSQMRFGTFNFVKAEKHNMANRLARLGLMLARTNKERHEAIQDFMLTNDSVTVACEVPVYLTDGDIGYFKSKGFTLDFEDCQTPITGHIDVLQLRNGMVHVLDYKPEAERADAVNQLTIYALALASRTSLAVRDIKCAWFDDKSYFEFFPLHAVYRKNSTIA